MNATLEPTLAISQLTRASDEELLLEYRQTGERDCFAQLVQRYERELFNYLRRYLGDAEMAEDAFQAAFLQVHLKCDQFEEGKTFRPWLYTIAVNQAIDAQRRNKRHRAVSLNTAPQNDEAGGMIDFVESDELRPEEWMDASERRDRVRQILSDMPESMRTVIELIYYQGLKYRDAAEILEVPVGTIKSRLHSAVAKFNDLWKKTQLEHP